MKKIFRKAMTILGSAALLGATVGMAAAASYPSPFTSNTVVVTGANADAMDGVGASSIVSGLNAVAAANTVTTLSGGSGVTEKEVPLGGLLNVSGSEITTTLTDTKIDSLLDTKINWDDGGASGADDYNVQEQILVGSATISTSLDKNDFEEMVALTNDRSLEYRYVFDDAFNVTGVGATGADDLYLTILGKSYEVSAMTATSITVVTSEETTLSPGESVTVDGKTFTLDDLSATAARVNGETVTTSSKKINGLQVSVKANSIFYNENFPDKASVTLQIGEEISKTYSDGEAYIGEDTADPEWVWTISDPSTAGGYIGVKYDWRQIDENDDVAYIGGSYIFPENFAEVKLEGLTEVDYDEFTVYFDTMDLYNATTTSSTENVDSAKVLVIKAESGDDDAMITTTGSKETDEIYLRWADDDEDINSDQNNASLEFYYRDVNGDVTDAIRPRFVANYSTTAATGNTITTDPDLANIIVGDTTISVTADVTSADMTLIFTDDTTSHAFTLDIAGSSALSETGGDLEWFGATTTAATSQDTAEATDIIVTSTNVGTEDNDVLTYNGIIIETPKDNLENDKVIFKVPSKRVYAEVSVLVGGNPASSTDTGIVTVTDTEAASMTDKNMIVVGGSAINSVAAELLGGAYSEADFTTNTGVAAGEFLIQSFVSPYSSSKTALLVAGYNKEDTSKAVTYLLNEDVDTTVGKKYKGTSATSAELVVTA